MIYLVEDDVNIREMESYALRNSGFEVMEFSESGSFWQACKKDLPELILLDIMLPNEDGISILKRLRADTETHLIPVILVTAKTTELDKVKGLDLGADDYITKPFGIMELVSRVKALMRRTTTDSASPVLQYEGIELCEEKRTVTAGGIICTLTYKEFELLKLLLINHGIVLSREKLMDKIWGFDYEGESRTVDMHIKTLRQKLGSYGELIQTVRNIGYKIDQSPFKK